MLAAETTEPTLYKDWGRTCKTPEGMDKEVCFIFQRVSLKESGSTILSVSVGYRAEQQKTMMVLTLPLGVSLIPGMEIQIDSGQVMRTPYSVCLANGCRAVFAIESPVIKAMQQGNRMQVTALNTQGKRLELLISLKGFTAAYNSIQK